ncbi:MAG: PQQ-binding-like beta-propeller repeat protein [Planctomycetaceae bacterium]|nr:PQQ-binding-like beta-propeller repeat protein [Planctomycetaceae bacterium]
MFHFFVCLFTIYAAGAEPVVHWGSSPQRNNVSQAVDLPESWHPGQFDRRSGKWIGSDRVKNVRWAAPLGTTSYSTPLVVGEKIFSGTNNKSGFDPKYPANVDLGVLVAFRRETGEFLGQIAWEKLDGSMDWPEQGICSNPAAEGNRLWLLNNRNEVVCLNIEPNIPEVLWSFNMVERLQTRPHHASCSSMLVLDDLLFTGTSNGVSADEKTVPAPNAPSFIALEKTTGELVWSDASPGENILDGQWGSPSALQWTDSTGKPRTQVIFPGGDGWLYGFEVLPKNEAKRVLPSWKFDCNPKEAVWKDFGRGDRSILVATPVVLGTKIYIATGQDPESGAGPGILWCLDPTNILESSDEQEGFIDLSEHLVLDPDGKPVPPRRTQAFDESQGEKIVANPDSAAIWSYRGKNPESKEFEDRFHRTISPAVVADGFVFTGDFAGVVHCLDAQTGDCYWTYDMMSTIWGGGLAADGKFFIGDTDGDVAVFEISKEFKLLKEINMGASIYAAPVTVGRSILISTCRYVFFVESGE